MATVQMSKWINTFLGFYMSEQFGTLTTVSGSSYISSSVYQKCFTKDNGILFENLIRASIFFKKKKK